MLRIGSLTLDSRVLLAPIAGHCDLPFRLVVRQCGGAALAFTDLLCPYGVLAANQQTQWLMATCEADRPLGMQLYGREGVMMADAARWAVDRGAATIDINMGCPVDKVTKTFAGAMMLCTPDHTVGVVEQVVRAVGDRVPVTAKLRLGYHRGERTAPQLARRLIGAGVACITIHGRTAQQRFKGSVDLDGIAEVTVAVREAGAGRVPCIGNGDIHTPFDAAHMIEHTGCDGVMIGRAALGAPWICRDTHTLLEAGCLGDELTLRQRLECVKLHFAHMLHYRGAHRAVMRMRQCISAYSRHLGPSRALQSAVRGLTEMEADRFDTVVDEFIDASGAAADRVPITWAERARQLAASTKPAPQRVTA